MYPPKRAGRQSRLSRSRGSSDTPSQRLTASSQNDQGASVDQLSLSVRGLGISGTHKPVREPREYPRRPPPDALRSIKQRAAIRAKRQASLAASVPELSIRASTKRGTDGQLQQKLNQSSSSVRQLVAAERAAINKGADDVFTPDRHTPQQRPDSVRRESVQQQPTIAKYVERFRHAVPTSPDDRVKSEQDFWWQQPSPPGSTSTPHSSASEARDRHEHERSSRSSVHQHRSSNNSNSSSSSRSSSQLQQQRRAGQTTGGPLSSKARDFAIHDGDELGRASIDDLAGASCDTMASRESHLSGGSNASDGSSGDLEKGSENGYFHLVDELQLDDLALKRRADQVLARYASLSASHEPQVDEDLELEQMSFDRERTERATTAADFRASGDSLGPDSEACEEGDDFSEGDEVEVEHDNEDDDGDGDGASMADMYDSFFSIDNDRDRLVHDSSGVDTVALGDDRNSAADDESFPQQQPRSSNHRSGLEEKGDRGQGSVDSPLHNPAAHAPSVGAVGTEVDQTRGAACEQDEGHGDSDDDDGVDYDDDRDVLPMYASGGPVEGGAATSSASFSTTKQTSNSATEQISSSSSSSPASSQHETLPLDNGGMSLSGHDQYITQDSPMTAQELEQSHSSPPPPPPPAPPAQPSPAMPPSGQVDRATAQAIREDDTSTVEHQLSDEWIEAHIREGKANVDLRDGNVLRNSYLLSSCSSEELDALDWTQDSIGNGSGRQGNSTPDAISDGGGTDKASERASRQTDELAMKETDPMVDQLAGEDDTSSSSGNLQLASDQNGGQGHSAQVPAYHSDKEGAGDDVDAPFISQVSEQDKSESIQNVPGSETKCAAGDPSTEDPMTGDGVDDRSSSTRVNVHVCSRARMNEVGDLSGRDGKPSGSGDHMHQHIKVKLLWSGSGDAMATEDATTVDPSESPPHTEQPRQCDSRGGGSWVDVNDARGGLVNELPLASVNERTSSVVMMSDCSQPNGAGETSPVPWPQPNHAMSCFLSGPEPDLDAELGLESGPQSLPSPVLSCPDHRTADRAAVLHMPHDASTARCGSHDPDDLEPSSPSDAARQPHNTHLAPCQVSDPALFSSSRGPEIDDTPSGDAPPTRTAPRVEDNTPVNDDNDQQADENVVKEEEEEEDPVRKFLMRDPIYAALDARIASIQAQLASLST